MTLSRLILRAVPDEVRKRLPTPNEAEGRSDFVGRCLSSDEVQREFGEGTDQAQAVCHARFEKVQKSRSKGRFTMSWLDNLLGHDDDKVEKLRHASIAQLSRMNTEELEAHFSRLNAQLSRLVENARTTVNLLRMEGEDPPEGKALTELLQSDIAKASHPDKGEGEEDEDDEDEEDEEEMDKVGELEKAESLADLFTRRINELRFDRSSVVTRLAKATGREKNTARRWLKGEIGCPGVGELRAAADVLVMDPELVFERAREDGCEVEAAEDRLEKAEWSAGIEGPDGAPVLFVGSSPTPRDGIRKQALTGPDGAKFAETYLEPMGLSRDEVAVGNLVPVVLTSDGGERRDPTPAELRAWSGWFWRQVEDIEPAHIVALGKQARDVLGEMADAWVPHPAAVRKFGERGEVARKLSDPNLRDPDHQGAWLTKEALGAPEGAEIAADDRAWDAGAARRKLRKWASSDGSGDRDKIDFEKYGRAFLARVGESGELGSYKLPVATVADGELTIVPNAVRNAASGLVQTSLERGEGSEIRKAIDGLLDQVNRQLASQPALVEKGEGDFELIAKDDEEQIGYYVVYEPFTEDAHGDWSAPEDIRRAAHTYAKKWGVVGEGHTKIRDDVSLVETAVAPVDMELPGGTIKEGGWFVGLQAESEEAWQKMVDGTWGGISMGGRGRKIDRDLEEVT